MNSENFREAVKRLLYPENIAVIGATPDTLWSRNLLGGLRAGGYRGQVRIVNPGRASVLGYPSFPTIDALPEPPDLGIILVGAKNVPDSMRELAAQECTSAYILAAGFESKENLASLHKLATELGMVILGPNCNGFIRPDAGLHVWTGPIVRPYKAGALAFISQSSAITASAIASAWERGLGFSVIISTGNQVNFTIADALETQIDNADTRAIICYIEQFGDFSQFAQVAIKCRNAGKAIIAIAAGTSQAAREITLSHTGALSAGAEVNAAALEALGIIQANDVDEALDYSSLFELLPKRAWREVKNVAVIAISGGYAALAADALSAYGLNTPPLPQEVLDVLPEVVPQLNPMDLTATVFGWADKYPEVIDRFITSDAYDAVVLMFGVWEGLERWFAPITARAYRTQKPVFVGGNEVLALSDTTRKLIDLDPFPHISGVARIARALAGMRMYFTRKPKLSAEWADGPRDNWVGGTVATVPELAPHLTTAGINVVRWTTVDVDGTTFPAALGDQVVLKLESPSMPHKTEFNAVRFPVTQADFAKVTQELAALAVREKLATWTIIAQEYIGNPSLELLAGIVVDPIVGPVLTVGLGGTQAEILRRTVQALCPLDIAGARELVERLGIAPLFAGYRGKPPLDPSVYDLLVCVSQWAHRHRGNLLELDLNPILVRPLGLPAVAADALARFRSHV
ncbi:MAG: acetate--CoA ligase family protein [Pseudomonadota bacterium]